MDNAKLIASPPHVRATRRLLIEPIGDGSHSFVFNPLSGSLDIATCDEILKIERLQRGDTCGVTQNELDELTERRIVFTGDDSEESYLEGLVGDSWNRMLEYQPEAYVVCPTLACNLACGYCFEGDSLTDKPQGVMTPPQVDLLFKAIEQLRHAKSSDVETSPPWICLFGGEPLLPSTRRCVAQILDRAASGGFVVGATTNGVNITRFADLLTQYAHVLTLFQVTLDGPRAVHNARRHRLGGQGTFDEIVAGIDLLLELGVEVDLRVNLDASNVDALPEFADFVISRGWRDNPKLQVQLAPIVDHGGTSSGSGGCGSSRAQKLSEMELWNDVMDVMERSPETSSVCNPRFLRHLEHLVALLEPERIRPNRDGGEPVAPGPRYWYCESGTTKQYVFTPEGLIYSCTESVGKRRNAIGEFDPALQIWRDASGRWLGKTILSHPKCRACSISTLCGGGCNFSAQEHAIPNELAGQSSQLLQIEMLAGSGAGRRRGLADIVADPFCAGAEQIVRSYLSLQGRKLMESD